MYQSNQREPGPASVAPPPRVTRKPPRWQRWVVPTGLAVLGFGVGMVFAFICLALLISTPLTTAPLAPPVSSNKSDAKLTLSQEYINREIAGLLNANPVKLLNVLEVKQVVIELKAGTQVKIAARAEAFGRQIDLNIKDNVSVKDGKVILSLAESVKAGGFELGFLNLNSVVENVNLFVAGEINKLIAGVGSALVGHTPNLQLITLSEGVLEATFEVKIGVTPKS